MMFNKNSKLIKFLKKVTWLTIIGLVIYGYYIYIMNNWNQSVELAALLGLLSPIIIILYIIIKRIIKRVKQWLRYHGY